MNFLNLIGLLSGLALFLYGISLMGDGLNKVAGDRLRHFFTFPGESLRFFFGAFGYGIKRLTDTI